MFDDPVQFPGGRKGSYLRIVQSGGAPGAAVLPLHRDQAGASRIGLVRVYRYPLALWEWAIPRGFAHGASAGTTAMREAEEELGARPDHLEEIGQVTPDSGLLSSVVRLFLAVYDRETASPQDRDEVSGVRWVPVTSLLHEIGSQQVTDAFTQSALCCAIARGIPLL